MKVSFLKRNQFLILLLLLGIAFLSVFQKWSLYAKPIKQIGREIETFLGMELFAQDGGETGKMVPGSDKYDQDGEYPGKGQDNGPGEFADAERGDDVNQTGERDNELGQAEKMPHQPVWETVEDSYFDNALFIGDSRIVGLRDYGKIEGSATYYVREGLNVFKLLSAKIVEVPNQRKKISVEDALKEKQFGKIYLMVGINELDIGTVERYEEAYREAVNRIRELQPDAIIYVQSIMLVTNKRAKKGDFVTNKAIQERNDAIQNLADNQHVFYLDVNEAIVDESGGMNPTYTTDGIHLKAKYVPVYADYLRTHAILPQ